MKIVKLNFGVPQKKNRVPKWKISKLFKIALNGKKICQKQFFYLLAPPLKKIGYLKKNLPKMKKNKIGQKWVCQAQFQLQLGWNEISFILDFPHPKHVLSMDHCHYKKYFIKFYRLYLVCFACLSKTCTRTNFLKSLNT